MLLKCQSSEKPTGYEKQIINRPWWTQWKKTPPPPPPSPAFPHPFTWNNRHHISTYEQNINFTFITCGSSRAAHYNDVIMGAVASRITSLTIVYSIVYSDADQRKHQSSASLAFVRGIHRGPVNSPHKWPVPRKMFPFDDVIMCNTCYT